MPPRPGLGRDRGDRYRVPCPCGIVNIKIAGINVDQYIIIVITGTGGHGNPPLQKFNNYHPSFRIIPILYNTCAFLYDNEYRWGTWRLKCICWDWMWVPPAARP